MSQTDTFSISVLFFLKKRASANMLMNGIKIRFYCIFVYTWKYNDTRNTIPFSVSKISFIFLMTPTDSNMTLVMIKIYAQSYLRVHLHINDETTHYRKDLKLSYLHCYTRKVSEIWRVETLIYQKMNVQFGKCRKLLEHRIYRE